MTDYDAIWRQHYVHPGSWDVDWPPRTLVEIFDEAVASRGAAPLADFMGAQISYRTVGEDAATFAAHLHASGAKPGDRIGLFLPNVPDYLIAYYGALKAGLIVVNMSPLYSLEELEHQIADSGARIIVTSDVPQLYDHARALLDRGAVDRLYVGTLSAWLPTWKRRAYRLFRRRDIARPDYRDPRIENLFALLWWEGADGFVAPPVRPDDVALIQYTGGTTGVPKGAMLTHRALAANAAQVHAIDPWREPDDDRIIGVLPFFHVFANTCVLNRTVLSGGMVAMLPRFDAAQTLKTITRTKATALPGVPTMYQALLDHPGIARTDFSSLRICISGGAPLPATVKARFEAASGSIVVEGYGLTESSGVVATNPYSGVNRTGTIGQPLPGTHIRLLDREDPTKLAADGEPGELAFRGPQAMSGYWGRPEVDPEVFADGYVRTGDVATIDPDGYIRIVDRLKDMIAVGGFKVFPSQIESVLYRHPDVHEAIVIGVPDDYSGEKPKAFVTVNAGAATSGDAIRDWLNPQLGKHERVIAVEVRDTLPKTLVGKLSRKELVAEERARAAAA